MTNTTAMGTLLFVGALFLSLNALAVSARPGDVSSAERSMTAIIPEVPISAPVVTGGGLEAVPVPPPALNPSLIGGSRPVAKQPATNPIGDPAAERGSGIQPLHVHVMQVQDMPNDGVGTYSPGLGVAPPVMSGPGDINPGAAPIPLPPVTPGGAKLAPGPTPPYSVDPVHEGL